MLDNLQEPDQLLLLRLELICISTSMGS